MQIEVTGADAVARALDALQRHVADPGDALDAIGALAAAEARRTVPRRTGRLAASIRVNRSHDATGSRVAVVIGNRTRVTYAPFPAYGTRYEAARPFLRRTDAVMRSKAEQEIERDIARTIDRNGLD